MKKVIVFLFFVTLLVLLNHEESIIIPKESIRYRIIASSNSKEDQALKWQINNTVMPSLVRAMAQNDLNSVRENLQTSLPEIEEKVKKYTDSYNISYGLNYFPEKEYAGVIYEEGNYESLVISLGNATGDNWWCVVFPPLCLMEAKKSDLSNVEYKSYIKTVIDRYF